MKFYFCEILFYELLLLQNFIFVTPKSWISGQSDILVLNDSEWPILPICNFSNLFPLKWLRITQNAQFCLIRNFSNLFPPKWLRMTQNGQFHPIRNFSNLFPPK